MVGVIYYNVGLVEVLDGGVLVFSGVFDNVDGGWIFLKSGVLCLDGGVINVG